MRRMSTRLPLLVLGAIVLWLWAGASPANAHSGHSHAPRVTAPAAEAQPTGSLPASEVLYLSQASSERHPSAPLLCCCTGTVSCPTGCGAVALLETSQPAVAP